MKNSALKLLGAVSGVTLAALAASPAFAAGTASGSTITNTVSVNFQVGGVAQTPVTASDTFTVDRKISLTVATLDATTTSVSPGQTNAVTAFTVTNSSNATLDFNLAVANQAGGAAPHGGTDNFDTTNLRMYVDTNNNGVYDAGDTLVTYLDEVAADTTKTVFVISDVPISRANGDIASVILTATAREGGGAGAQGAAITQTAGANTTGVDTVFADGAGSTDSARDGAFSAKDDYTVAAPTMTVVKTSRLISDPLNGTTNPKQIPGATVEYCIAVTNAAGGATASTVAISDVLPTATTYTSGFGILVGGTVTGAACNADGATGGSFSSGTVSATLATLAAGTTRTIVFRVTIN